MDDTGIDELCRRIYQNHRQALGLIVERVGTPSAQLIGMFEDLLLGQPDRWLGFHKTAREVHLGPTGRLAQFPPIGTRKNVDPRVWLRYGFRCDEGECTIWCHGFPTTDPGRWRHALARLTAHADEFGLPKPKKGITDEWTSVRWEWVAKWPEDDEPDRAAHVAAASAKLDAL